MNYSKYIGIDAHKQFCVFHMIDTQTGKEESIQVPTTKESINSAFTKLVGDKQQETIAVVESTYNWIFVYETVSSYVDQVKLANPKRLKAISSAKVKTDKVDAKLLARLLKADMIPEVYVSREEERALKDILRYRGQLIQSRTRLKNRIHAYMARYGITFGLKDTFGAKGMDGLLSYPWPEPVGSIVERLLDMIQDLNNRILEVDGLLKENLKENETIKLLSSIPGIGIISANTIASETGDIARFPGIKPYVSYCGLSPGIRSSGGKTVKTRSKERNRYLQSILIEVAHIAAKVSPVLKQKYASIRERKGPNKARVAVARRLAEAVFKVLSRKQPFREGITLRFAAPSR